MIKCHDMMGKIHADITQSTEVDIEVTVNIKDTEDLEDRVVDKDNFFDLSFNEQLNKLKDIYGCYKDVFEFIADVDTEAGDKVKYDQYMDYTFDVYNNGATFIQNAVNIQYLELKKIIKRDYSDLKKRLMAFINNYIEINVWYQQSSRKTKLFLEKYLI